MRHYLRQLSPIALVLVATAAACSPETGSETTDGTDLPIIPVDTDTDSPESPLSLHLPPPAIHEGEYAISSTVCAECHTASEASTALRDSADRPIGPADLWPGTMMAHAARDPIFLTALAVERQENPALGASIDAECFACHSPAAHAEVRFGQQPTPTLESLAKAAGPSATMAGLARDGAGCVGCHLQTADTLGAEETFSGAHPFNASRELYGPHRGPFAGPMRNRTGFSPVASDHVYESQLCASCHTLEVETVDATGARTGHRVIEQGPYLEWRASNFNPERGAAEAAECQTCHMPMTDDDGVPIKTKIARNTNGSDFPRTYARQPVARHTLWGGNAYALELIRDRRDEVGSPATSEQLQASIDGTRDMLTQAAAVELAFGGWSDGRIQATITVLNQTGHKFPTGFPARRAWLEVVIQDSTGSTVFHSGKTSAKGQLLTSSGAVHPAEAQGGPTLPHVNVIRTPDDIALWESVLEDPDGNRTDSILRASGYAKDNRLLPVGWNPSPKDAVRLQPVGTDEDPDFAGGRDQITLDWSPSGTGPWTVEATLRFQPLQPRYLDHLTAGDNELSKQLNTWLEARPVPAEWVAASQLVMPTP